MFVTFGIRIARVSIIIGLLFCLNDCYDMMNRQCGGGIYRELELIEKRKKKSEGVRVII